MPDLTPIEDWAQINSITDPVEKRIKYRDYLIEGYAKEGSFDDDTALAIQDATYAGLVKDGKTPEQALTAMQPKPLSFEQKLDVVSRSNVLRSSEEDERSVAQYLGFLSVVGKGDVTDEYLQSGEELRSRVEEIVENSYEDAAQDLVAQNYAPLARVENTDGRISLVGGQSAYGKEFYDVYQESLKAGTIRPEDILLVKKAMQRDENGIEQFRHDNTAIAAQAISKSFDDHDRRNLSTIAELVADGKDLSGIFHMDMLVQSLQSKAEHLAQMPEEDIRKAIEFQAGFNAMMTGLIEYDDENPSNNLRRYGHGYVVMHPEALINKNVFSEIVSTLSPTEQKKLEAQRETLRIEMFDGYSDTLSRTYLSDEWQTALSAGKSAGKSNPDILDEFINANKENYNYFRNEIVGQIGSSIPEATTELAWGVGVMSLNSETALEALLENARDRQARRQLAQMFGEKMGVEIDVGTMIAPIITDMGATVLITLGTAGTLTAPTLFAIGAKYNARILVRQLVRSTVSGAFRVGAKETVDQAAARIAASNLIKGVGKKESTAIAKDAIQSYTKLVSSKWVQAPALFTTAGTRSGTMTYVTVYDALDRDPQSQNLTDEEKHQKALTAGLTAAAFTGFLSTGFSLAGRGGLEKFLNSGATRRDMKNLFSSFAGRELTDDVFDATLRPILKDGAKKFMRGTGGRELLGSVRDEALEEGFDEAVNAFIVASATDQDLPLLDLMRQTAMGAAYGGLFGAALPLAKKTLGRLTTGTAMSPLQAETDLVNRMVSDLEKAGSPMTAEAVRDRLRKIQQTPAQKPKPAEPAVETAAEPAVETAAEPAAEPATPEEEAVAEADAQLKFAQQTDEEFERENTRQVLIETLGNATDEEIDAAIDEAMRMREEYDADPEREAIRRLIIGYADNPTAEEVEAFVEEEMMRRYYPDAEPDAETAAETAAEPDAETAAEPDAETAAKPAAEPDAETAAKPAAEPAKKTAKKAAKKTAKKAAKKKAKKAAKKKAKKKAPAISPRNTEALEQQQKLDTRVEEQAQAGDPNYIRGGGSKQQIKEANEKLQTRIKELYPPLTKQEVLELYDLDSVDSFSKKFGYKRNDIGYLFDNDPKRFKKAQAEGHKIEIPDNFDKKRLNPYILKLQDNTAQDRDNTADVTERQSNQMALNFILKPDTPITLREAGFVPRKVFKRPAKPRKKEDESVEEYQTRVQDYRLKIEEIEKAEKDLEEETRKEAQRTAKKKKLTPEEALTQARDKVEQKYVLNGEMTPEQAMDEFKKWFASAGRTAIDENQLPPSEYQNIVEGRGQAGRMFRFAANIERSGLNKENTELLRSLAASDFFVEIESQLRVKSLVNSLGELITVNEKGKFTIADNNLEEAIQIIERSFDIESAKKELEDIEFIGVKEATKIDLKEKAKTDRQQLAAYLYVLSGGSGSQAKVKFDIFTTQHGDKGSTRYLSKNWDSLIIREFVTGTADHFVSTLVQSNKPFPNFIKVAMNSGNRVRVHTKGLKASQRALVGGDALEGMGGVEEDSDRGKFTIRVSPEDRAVLAGLRTFLPEVRRQLEAADQKKVNTALRAIAYSLGGDNRKIIDTDDNVDLLTEIVSLAGNLSKKDIILNQANRTLANQIDSLPKAVGLFILSSGKYDLSYLNIDSSLSREINAIRNLIEKERRNAPNMLRGRDLAEARRRNQRDLESLGIEAGNPQSVIDAIRQISKTSKSRSHRAIAELLLKFTDLIQTVDLQIIDDATRPAGTYQQFSDGTKEVKLNIASRFGRGMESVVLHEYLHAATATLLRTERNLLTSRQRLALSRLEGLRKIIQNEYAKSGKQSAEMEYGLQNMDEFIAMTFTSASFQNAVRGLKKRGLLRRVIDAVRDLFNIPSKTRLDAAFSDLIDFLNIDSVGSTTSLGRFDSLVEAFSRPDPYGDAIRRGNELLDPTVDSDPETRYSAVSDIAPDVDMTAEEQQQLDDLIEETVREYVPTAVPVALLNDETEVEGVFDAQPNSPAVTATVELDGESTVAMFINLRAMREKLAQKNGVILNEKHARTMVAAVLTDKLAHAAEMRTITTEELDAALEGISDADLLSTVDRYTQNAEINAQLKEGILSGDMAIKRQILGEMLRMKLEKLSRGFTAEEDMAFYASSPSAARIFLRYFTGMFRRLHAQLTKDGNGEIAELVNRMSNEMALLRRGTYQPLPIKNFSISSPDESLFDLEQRFAATLPVKEEDGKRVLNVVDENTTDEQVMERLPMLRAFEIPLGIYTRDGKYKPNTLKIQQMVNGKLDPRILNLSRQAAGAEIAVTQYADTILRKITKLLESRQDISNELLADYLGRPNATQVSDEFISFRNKVFQESIMTFERENGRPLSSDERQETYTRTVLEPISVESKRLYDEAKLRKDKATDTLIKSFPELHEQLQELRLVLDSLSKRLVSTGQKMGLEGEIRAVVDRNLGIYITRGYKAFMEEGYMDTLLKLISGDASSADATMVEAYEQAIKFFESEFIRAKTSSLRRQYEEKGEQKTSTEIKEEAERDLNTNLGQAQIREAIHSYLNTLDSRNKYRKAPPRLAKSVARTMVDNLRERKNVPEPIRRLLGEYDDADAVDNVTRSVHTVNRMLANESFNANLIALGHDPDAKSIDDGFIFTRSQLQVMSLDGQKIPSMLNVRTGTQFTFDAEKETTGDPEVDALDTTLEYFIVAEAYDDMQRQFSREVRLEERSADKQWVESTVNSLRFVTGASLGVKTLGSIGFYLRNMLGNVAFFGPMQGVNPLKIVAQMKYLKKAFRADPKAVDAYQAELIGLNVLSGDITSSLIRDLVSGKTNPDSMNEEINGLMDKLKSLGNSKAAKLAKEQIYERALTMSQAVDDFYKIAYFENEVSYLKKARQWDKDNNKDTGFSNLTDYEIKQRAAEKVRQTSQSYQDAYETVKYISRSYGFLLAPFLRFKTDIIRITINTPRLIRQEMQLDKPSDQRNPIEFRRGMQRLAGFSTVSVGFSMLAPTVVRMIMGIGEDEDESYRETVPDYKKDSTFFYLPDIRDSSKIETWDMTFLNPMASIADPVLRLAEKTLRGKPLEGLSQALGMIFSEYGGEQIFLGTVNDLRENSDAATGDEIYNVKRDGAVGGFINATTYLYQNAFEPRIGKATREAINAVRGDVPIDPDKRAMWIIANEFKPVKSWDVDPQQAFHRFLTKKRDERNQLRSQINKLKSRSSLTEGEIRSIARKYVENTRDIDKEIRAAYRAFGSFGLTKRQAANVMSSRELGMGKRRRQLIMQNTMMRPNLSPPFIDDVSSLGPVGVQRRRIFEDVLSDYPQFMRLED